jgi:hypothetical protein
MPHRHAGAPAEATARWRVPAPRLRAPCRDARALPSTPLLKRWRTFTRTARSSGRTARSRSGAARCAQRYPRPRRAACAPRRLLAGPARRGSAAAAQPHLPFTPQAFHFRPARLPRYAAPAEFGTARAAGPLRRERDAVSHSRAPGLAATSPGNQPCNGAPPFRRWRACPLCSWSPRTATSGAAASTAAATTTCALATSAAPPSSTSRWVTQRA